jgi:DNA-binding protein
MTQFSEGRKEIVLKARGRAISHAVDIAEIVRRKFVQDATIKGVGIGTEVVEGDNKEKLNVSSIEIILAKPA